MSDESTKVKNPEISPKSGGSPENFDTSVFVVDFTKGLKKFWYIILVLVVIFGTGAFAYGNSTYVPMYRSSVSFKVTTATANGSSSAFSAYYDSNSASQLASTFPYIIGTPMMSNALINQLGVSYVNGSISCDGVIDGTNIFTVSVSSASPEDAYNITNAFIDVFPDVAQFVTGNIQLKILIKPTLSNSPYTTNPTAKTVAVAIVCGFALGLGIIAVYAFFKNTVRKKDDFKNKLNQKCLVEVPFVVFHRKSKNNKSQFRIVQITGKHPIFKESFRLLQKRISKHMNTKRGNVIAVTSAIYGEGKTTVALNLARAFAMAGSKTAIVDLDLDRRTLQKYFSDIANVGFTSALSMKSSFFENIAVEDKTDANLFFYFAGNHQIKNNEHIFVDFMEYLRNNYTYIILNAPSFKKPSNAVMTCNLSDGILFTVKQDSVSIDKIKRSLEYLSFSSGKILGFVFNGVQEGFSGYGGYYYGGKYGYGRYGRYGNGKYGGYSRYGYGRFGYGDDGSYGDHAYGYGEREYGYGYDRHEYENESHHNNSDNKNSDVEKIELFKDISEIPEDEIPDNNI